MTEQTNAPAPAEAKKVKGPRRETTRIGAAVTIAATHPELVGRFREVLGRASGDRLAYAKKDVERIETETKKLLDAARLIRDFAAEIDEIDGPMLEAVRAACGKPQKAPVES